MFIFGNRADFTPTTIIILGFAILFLHLGHMIFSAGLDIMNPQNEQYATSGEVIDNPNENKSTIFAFIISIVFAIVSYKLFSEATVTGKEKDIIICVSKLLFISLAYFGSMFYLFVKKVKAFYYEIQG